MKNILICLEKLDIGGVETFVSNQVMSFKRQGFEVVVLCSYGIYVEKVKALGAIVIDHSFELKNEYDKLGIKKINKIISDYKISEVHIHQFPCLLSALPASVENDIPYVAYAHSMIDNVFDWYMNNYPIYEELFKVYFECASKIIAITPDGKNFLLKKFKLKNKNCFVINNSISFKTLSDLKRTSYKIKKFLIVSRLSSEKLTSIENGIKLFSEISKTDDDGYVLTIVGDGKLLPDIKNIVNKMDINSKVNFVGATSNVYEYMCNYDVLIGVDRCILEAISIGIIPVISGYKELKGIVTPDNIQNASIENFSGNNLKSIKTKEIVNSLINLNEIEIRKIVCSNKKFAVKNLDINKQDYFALQNGCNYDNLDYFFNIHDKLIEEYNKNISLERKLYELNHSHLEESNIAEALKAESKNLENELIQIRNSKRWKMVDKFSNFIGKINGGKND